MAVRPPSNGVDDEPDVLEFGIAALDARVEEREVSFPVSAAELTAEYGNMDVPVDPAGHEMPFETALDRCDRETFDSKQDLLNALHPVFEAERERRSGGILGRLRSLLPF